MAQLLKTIDTELDALDDSASASLSKLLGHSETFLQSLRQLESQLQSEIDNEEQDLAAGEIVQSTDKTATTEVFESLKLRKHSLASADHDFVDTEMSEGRVTPIDSTSLTDDISKLLIHQKLDNASLLWYKGSIDELKKYNVQITKFLKNVVQKLNVSLDDAYTFPLLLPSYPLNDRKDGVSESSLNKVQCTNQDQLLKSIILHLLKIGQGSIAEELLKEYSMESQIDPKILRDFKKLSIIVDDIKTRHDLSNVLDWLESRSHANDADYQGISFKFHMLQFAILLSSRPEKTPDQAVFEAYTYAKQKFPAFFQNYLTEMSPIITCILFSPSDGLQLDLYLADIKQMTMRNYIASCEKGKRNTKETRFVAQLLENLHSIHENQFLFNTLAHDFVAKFCSDLSLSCESSLFQSILSGFVNLPNFYRYNHLQRKLKRPRSSDSEDQALVKKDLPFQIPDKNQFLFNYHPLFICPISKEQLTPLVTVSKIQEQEGPYKSQRPLFIGKNKALVPMANPVVVFGHCRHLALKDSVRQLTKGGAEVFKCHYCYKKHKLLEVSEAYFIDL